MVHFARFDRRMMAGALSAAAITGAALCAAAPSALADDPAANPPNCSAADLAGVASGVSASTSAYLFSHPDVNAFYTSLEGLPREEVGKQAARYLDANPIVKAEISGIRQPLVDLKNRCGSAPPPALP